MSPLTAQPSPPVSLAPVRVVRKYLNIFRVSLIERMAYRGDFFLGTVLRFFPMITTILFWQAIYAGAGDSARQREKFAGYSLQETVAYLLLVHVSRMFSSMPGLAAGIARDIRDGNLKKYLLQPLDMIGYLVAHRAAHKTAYIATSFVPYALLFVLCGGYFTTFPTGWAVPAYLLSLVLGFVIGFFFEATMGMIGFWFLEVTSILWVVNTVNFFISGQMFPLEFLPAPVARVLEALPFQYLAAFQCRIFLGKIAGAELARGLLLEVAWAVAMITIARLLFRRGLRRYSAFGG